MALLVAVIAAVVVSAGSAPFAQSVAPTTTVVFVCEHGAAKSVVAAAHFNKLAQERGLAYRAISRGTDPDAAVPPRVRDGLQAEGLAVDPRFTPLKVSHADVHGVARVVTFDVTLPFTADGSSLARWDALPAFSDGYGPASAAIAEKVDRLVRELAESRSQDVVVVAVSGMR